MEKSSHVSDLRYLLVKRKKKNHDTGNIFYAEKGEASTTHIKAKR
jgi:hypothetical protein